MLLLVTDAGFVQHKQNDYRFLYYYVEREIRTFLLHGILRCPLSCCAIVPGSVRLKELRNIWNQWIIWVGIRQEGTNGQ